MSGPKKKEPTPPELPPPRNSSEISEAPRRLVIEHTDGPLTGLFRIVGFLAGTIHPVLSGPMSIGGESHLIQSAVLVKIYPKWYHYRERKLTDV